MLGSFFRHMHETASYETQGGVKSSSVCRIKAEQYVHQDCISVPRMNKFRRHLFLMLAKRAAEKEFLMSVEGLHCLFLHMWMEFPKLSCRGKIHRSMIS